jgi:hypothetical protein
LKSRRCLPKIYGLDGLIFLVNCNMDPKEYSYNDESPKIFSEEEMDLLWKAEEEKRIRESIQSSYTERFLIMMRLMRIDNMLSRAKVTHKKMD